MFPCSTLQKAWLGTAFSWQAQILTCRCEVVYSNMQMFHPLRGFSKTCLWCTTWAVPANSQLSLREGCSGKALQDITFSSAFMFREKLGHYQASDLCCCAPSAHLLLPSYPTILWQPYLLTPLFTTFLSQICFKNNFSLFDSFPCYSAPEPQFILYPLLWPCLTQRTGALGLAELCLKHVEESLEAERVKLISSNSNLLLILRYKRSFFLTWITGIGSEVMPLWYPGLP